MMNHLKSFGSTKLSKFPILLAACCDMTQTAYSMQSCMYGMLLNSFHVMLCRKGYGYNWWCHRWDKTEIWLSCHRTHTIIYSYQIIGCQAGAPNQCQSVAWSHLYIMVWDRSQQLVEKPKYIWLHGKVNSRQWYLPRVYFMLLKASFTTDSPN